MSKAFFTILRQCEHCAAMFEAQKRTTRYCSHRCNSANYKLRKRLEAKKQVEAETLKGIRPKYNTKALSLEMIKQKEFLTVSEVATLFNCSKKTIYRMIKANQISAKNLSERLTRIRRKDIEQMFEPIKKEAPKVLTPKNCYQMDELVNKYNVSRNTIYAYGKKHNIQRIKQNGITYYSKTDIDNLFNP